MTESRVTAAEVEEANDLEYIFHEERVHTCSMGLGRGGIYTYSSYIFFLRERLDRRL